MDKKYISDNKRVILITGDHNKWYEQAIFIVKKNAMGAVVATDLIAEAEMIVNNYLGSSSPANTINYNPEPQPKQKGKVTEKQRTRFDTVINMTIILAAIGLLVLLSRAVF